MGIGKKKDAGLIILRYGKKKYRFVCQVKGHDWEHIVLEQSETKISIDVKMCRACEMMDPYPNNLLYDE